MNSSVIGAPVRRQLIVRHYEQACAAASNSELWRNVTNDQYFDLNEMLYAATGRDLSAFGNIAAEDWNAMTSLIASLGRVVAKLNVVLVDEDWSDKDRIDVVLKQVQDEAAGQSTEYCSIVASLSQSIRFYCAFGDQARFDEKRLIGLEAIITPPVLDESRYDVFVSYKIARNSAQASWLVERLKGLGYRVWFDQDVLDKAINRPEVFIKEHLIQIIVHAVKHSKCTVVFETSMQAAQLAPDVTEEETLAKRTTMKFRSDALIAWDWQIVEIAATQLGVAIHPGTVVAFQVDDEETRWTKSFYYANSEELLACLKAAFELHDVKATAKSIGPA